MKNCKINSKIYEMPATFDEFDIFSFSLKAQRIYFMSVRKSYFDEIGCFRITDYTRY